MFFPLKKKKKKKLVRIIICLNFIGELMYNILENVPKFHPLFNFVLKRERIKVCSKLENNEI